uniref:U16-Nephitoxin-Nsp1a_1 n=1 Tax=Nephila sp. SGP-2016 TaxID=1905176 RepID=A0A4Q8KAS9_9ARAC
MNKLVIGFVLMLVLNCLVEATPAMKDIGMKALRSATFRAEGKCRKKLQTCNPPNRCCPDLACYRNFGDGILMCQERLF